MSESATKRRLLEQANLLVKTNDATTTLSACAALLDALGSLMSEWTGEVVRVRMTAEGQPDTLDMVKRPEVPCPVCGAEAIHKIEDLERVRIMPPNDADSRRASARSAGVQSCTTGARDGS